MKHNKQKLKINIGQNYCFIYQNQKKKQKMKITNKDEILTNVFLANIATPNKQSSKIKSEFKSP